LPLASMADRTLSVEARPDKRFAAFDHGAIDFDAILISTDRSHAIVAGACLLALQGLTHGKFGQLGRSVCP